MRVSNEFKKTPADQQGETPFVNLTVEGLPSSSQLMSHQSDAESDSDPDSEEDPFDADTIFKDVLTARKYREVLLPSKAQQDGTIPQTKEKKWAHVRVLFKAFKMVPQNSDEGEKTKEKFVNMEHNNALVEAVCWELLEDCIRRSEKTMNLVEGWEPGKVKGKTEDWTFEKRFDYLVQAMAQSKSICKHLFDVPFRVKLVDDPLRSAKRVASNRVLNEKKAESLKRGRQAEKEDEEKAKRPKTARCRGAQVDNNLAPQTTRQPPHQGTQMAASVMQQQPTPWMMNAAPYPIPTQAFTPNRNMPTNSYRSPPAPMTRTSSLQGRAASTHQHQHQQCYQAATPARAQYPPHHQAPFAASLPSYSAINPNGYSQAETPSPHANHLPQPVQQYPSIAPVDSRPLFPPLFSHPRAPEVPQTTSHGSDSTMDTLPLDNSVDFDPQQPYDVNLQDRLDEHSRPYVDDYDRQRPHSHPEPPAYSYPDPNNSWLASGTRSTQGE